jgi:hypothetical protein
MPDSDIGLSHASGRRVDRSSYRCSRGEDVTENFADYGEINLNLDRRTGHVKVSVLTNIPTGHPPSDSNIFTGRRDCPR